MSVGAACIHEEESMTTKTKRTTTSGSGSVRKKLALSRETLRDLKASGKVEIKGGISGSKVATRMNTKIPLTGAC
jgi:hypothetical protein